MTPLPTAPLRYSIRRKVVLGFGVVLVMLGLIAFVSYRTTHLFIENAEWVARTHMVLEIEERAQRHIMEMESGRRGFLVTGDEGALRGYETAQSEIIDCFNALKVYTADTPQQTLKLDRLLLLIQRSFSLQAAEIEVRRSQGQDAGAQLFAAGESAAATRDIRQVLADFSREQRALLREREDLTQSIGNTTSITILVGSLMTFITLMISCGLILRDVAARQHAERALAAEQNLLLSIIDTIPDHVFVKDTGGRYLLDNVAHRRLLGATAEKGAVGRTVYDFFSPAEAKRYDDDDRYVIDTGERIINREERVPQADGTEVWFESTKVPLRNALGKIVGLVGISKNISARKIAEQMLTRSAAQLARSNAELQNFASVASHDLQEPLRKIQAFGGRLRMKCAEAIGAQGRDYLERMEGAAQRMQVLIHDLLQLSRVTSRAMPFEKCKLGEIVLAVVSDLEVAIEQKNAHVEIGWLPTIEADPVQMRQLFQNLISNALKFQQPGVAPIVSISGRVREADERQVVGPRGTQAFCEITIQDNGIGFSPTFAEQIFVVFQRLHSRSEFEGTGIGLAVCRKITDRHGGTIVAKSAEGQGATFLVTLPLKQPPEPPHE
jgi:PAS domain S-box-containing protein